MKIKFILLLFVSNICISQIKFEEGYYKDNSGNTTKCLIRNADWLNNPTFIEVKFNQDEKSERKTINEISEFGVYNMSKFVKATVKIDDFDQNISSLDGNRDPVFKEKTLFLKVENEGLANLYSYKNRSLFKYFYSTNTVPITMLVYKAYMADADKINYNVFYIQQLINDLNLNEAMRNEALDLKYVSDDFNAFFSKYNNNGKPKSNTDLSKKESRKKFLFAFRPGVNISSTEVSDRFTGFYDSNLGTTINLRLGFEAEYIFPFNKNKWSFIAEPTYDAYSSNSTSNSGLASNILYNTLNLNLGLRHRMYINSKSNFFVNIGYLIARNIGDSQLEIGTNKLDLFPINTYTAGVGFKYSKYSVEFRLKLSQNLTERYGIYQTNHSFSSIIFSYNIF
jgi:hypothetical protein